MSISVLPGGVLLPLFPFLPKPGGRYPFNGNKGKEGRKGNKVPIPPNGNLRGGKTPKWVKPDRQTAFDTQNAEAARLILADPDVHGGPEGLAVRWARLVVERGGLSVELQQMPEQAELFAEVLHADAG